MSKASSARAARGEFTAAGRRAGRARAAALEGLDLELSKLDDLCEAIGGPAMKSLMEDQTRIMWQDALSRARFGKTGRYREAIKMKVFDNPDGYVGTVFVIQGPWDRKPSVLWPKNLPLWLELGTRLMKQAYPHLLPAFHAARERLNRAVDRLLHEKAA